MSVKRLIRDNYALEFADDKEINKMFITVNTYAKRNGHFVYARKERNFMF